MSRAVCDVLVNILTEEDHSFYHCNIKVKFILYLTATKKSIDFYGNSVKQHLQYTNWDKCE